MLTENYILDALQAEREGEQFPIDFDVVKENYGYSAKSKKLRLVLNILENWNADGEVIPELWGFETPPKYQLNKNNKLFLSVKAYKFSLARANTAKGARYLLHLLDIEERFLARLERSLTLTVSDIPGYTHTLDSLWKDSGIVSRYQVKKAIIRDFIKGTHYHEEDGTLHLTEICYTVLMYSFRKQARCIEKRSCWVCRLGRILSVRRKEISQHSYSKTLRPKPIKFV